MFSCCFSLLLWIFVSLWLVFIVLGPYASFCVFLLFHQLWIWHSPCVSLNIFSAHSAALYGFFLCLDVTLGLFWTVGCLFVLLCFCFGTLSGWVSVLFFVFLQWFPFLFLVLCRWNMGPSLTPRLVSETDMMFGRTLQQDAEVKHIKDYCSSRSLDNVDE